MMMRRAAIALLGSVILLSGLRTHGHAQALTPPDTPRDTAEQGSAPTARSDPDTAGRAWQWGVSPYLWASGVKGTVGIKGTSAPIDESFSDIISDLDFGLMLIAEGRHGSWSGFIDLFYVALSDNEDLPGVVATNEAKVKQHQFLAQPTLGYSVVQGPWGFVDATVGVRYWFMDLDVNLLRDGTTVVRGDGRRNWGDVVGGLRTRVHRKKWRFNLLADLGGGGSRFTWQMMGAFGYDVAKAWTIQAGYRMLDVDYRHSGVIYDTKMHGPLLGVSFRF